MSETDRGGSLSRTQKCTKGLLRFNKESIQNVHTLPTNRNLLVYELLLEWPTSVKKGFIKREALRPLRTNSFQTVFEVNIKKTFVLGPNTTLMTSIFQKKTFTGLYTKWDSFTPPFQIQNKLNPPSDLSLVPNLLLLFFATICPGWSKKTCSSEWLLLRNNQLTSQWCFGTKPKQARCSCSYGS